MLQQRAVQPRKSTKAARARATLRAAASEWLGVPSDSSPEQSLALLALAAHEKAAGKALSEDERRLMLVAPPPTGALAPAGLQQLGSWAGDALRGSTISFLAGQQVARVEL